MELIEPARLKEVRRLAAAPQRRHNGKPWEPLPPGSARTGRRSEEEEEEEACHRAITPDD
ncbi:hypothetical protein AB6813_11590 [bacterium RCC_150]